jgi:hypothetical protein
MKKTSVRIGMMTSAFNVEINMNVVLLICKK